MKKLFFILTALMFFWGQKAIVSAREADEARLVAKTSNPCAALAEAPKIDFSTSYGKLRYDFSYSQRDLTALGKNYGILEQGLFAAGLAVVGVNWEISLNTVSRVIDENTLCVVPIGLNIFVGYNDPVIYMSSGLKPGGCDYNVVLRHEQTHHQINKAALEYFIPRLRQSILEISGHVKPIKIDTISRIDEATNKLTDAYIKEISPLIAHFKQELMREQGKLDNQTNYKMEGDLCRAFNRRPKIGG